MELFKEWDQKAYNPSSQKEYDDFWSVYLEEEKNIYEDILKNKENHIKTNVSNFAKKYNIPEFKVTGFLDGVNSSLKKEVNLEELDENSEFEIDIDFEKLYFNMLDAKAPWLYELEAWNDILTEERRKEISRNYKDSKTIRVEKTGRNEPCPCGSGKKYKKCCGK